MAKRLETYAKQYNKSTTAHRMRCSVQEAFVACRLSASEWGVSCAAARFRARALQFAASWAWVAGICTAGTGCAYQSTVHRCTSSLPHACAPQHASNHRPRGCERAGPFAITGQSPALCLCLAAAARRLPACREVIQWPAQTPGADSQHTSSASSFGSPSNARLLTIGPSAGWATAAPARELLRARVAAAASKAAIASKVAAATAATTAISEVWYAACL